MDLLCGVTYPGTVKPACSIHPADVDAVFTASRGLSGGAMVLGKRL